MSAIGSPFSGRSAISLRGVSTHGDHLHAYLGYVSCNLSTPTGLCHTSVKPACLLGDDGHGRSERLGNLRSKASKLLNGRKREAKQVQLEKGVASPHYVQDLNGLMSSGVRPTKELLHDPNIISHTLLWVLRSSIKLIANTVVVNDQQKLFSECHDELVPGLKGRLKTLPPFCSTAQGNWEDLPGHVGL
ncbi:uncharacterized protein LOC142817648 [Rhipicephalus microplus]|uniref:uncharacterized protein LOC142817648 n=1 Tax=Rhipicephalus microplus TaxID=6941 RepID=UPI003F6C6003